MGQRPDDPPGLITEVYRPPVGLENRTPREFHRYGNVRDRHRRSSMMEGACPNCSGKVATSFHVCEDHDELFDASRFKEVRDAVERVAVTSEDPMELEVTVELDGDRLAVTLDDEARVIDVSGEE